MKTIAGSGLPQQSMFDLREPSPPCFYFPHKAAAGGASLSSCRKPEPNNQGVEPEIRLFDAQKYFNDSGTETKVGKRVSPFNNAVNHEHTSERYDFSSIPRFSSASSSVDGYSRNYSARSSHAMPTASSEASWNSQTGLLSNSPGATGVSVQNSPRRDDKKKGSASKWLFGRKCPCSGKKSVQVEDNLPKGKKSVQVEETISKGKCPCTGKKSVQVESLSEFKATSRPGLNTEVSSINLKNQSPTPIPNAVDNSLVTAANRVEKREAIPITHRISAGNGSSSSSLGQYSLSTGRPFSDSTNGFTFPILSQTPSPIKVVLNGLPSSNHKTPAEDPPRDSLEVFQLANDPIPAKSVNDHHRRHSFIGVDDDMISDASSDLFEIESFTTQTTTYPTCDINPIDAIDDDSAGFNTRSLGDASGRGLPSTGPTEIYEPSEVSFDWSVTTAEGLDRESIANFSVTASEADEMDNIMRNHEAGKHTGSGGGKRKEGNGRLLLSCRREKAVSVGPQPVKCVPIEGQRVASSTLRHVTGRPPAANKPPLARSPSTHLPSPFAT